MNACAHHLAALPPLALPVAALGTVGLVSGIAALLLLIWLAWTFNRLVGLRNRVRESFSGMDVQLKRRHDLIPQIVETVKGYAAHERTTLDEVVRARRDAEAASALPDREAREAALQSSVRHVMLLAEQYPLLKADASFRGLQADLVAVEEAIQYARRYYNGTVRDLNTSIEQVPTLLVAGSLGFRPQPFFGLDAPEERAVPTVDLHVPPSK